MSNLIRTIATAGLNTIETAVVKATFEDNDRPKNKHVQTIVEWVNIELKGSGNTYHRSKKENIVTLFQKRIQTNNWRVVLKALIVIHTLFRDADGSFMDEFQYDGPRHVLRPCHNFYDRSTLDGNTYSAFVRVYSQYLSEKLHIFSELKYNFEKKLDPSNKKFFASYSPIELGNCLPKAMKQLDALIDCEASVNGSAFSMHELCREALLLLVKDSLRLYPSIQLCLWEMICKFQKLSLAQAQWTSRTCDRYFRLNEKFRDWFNSCVRFGIVQKSYTPKFDVLSETLVEKLKEYIESHEGDSDENGSDEDSLELKKKRKKQKSKKKARKKDRRQKSKEEPGSIGNINDLLNGDELQTFEKEVKKIKKHETYKSNYRGKFSKNEQKEKPNSDDLLTFSDDLFSDDPFFDNEPLEFTSPKQSTTTEAKASANSGDDWLTALTMNAPNPVSDAAMAWSSKPNMSPNASQMQPFQTQPMQPLTQARYDAQPFQQPNFFGPGPPTQPRNENPFLTQTVPSQQAANTGFDLLSGANNTFQPNGGAVVDPFFQENMALNTSPNAPVQASLSGNQPRQFSKKKVTSNDNDAFGGLFDWNT